MDNSERGHSNLTRRTFLQTVSAGAPTLSLVLEREASRQPVPPPVRAEKCSPIDFTALFNASSRDLGPRKQVAGDGLLRTPAGNQSLRGVPFRLGPDGLDDKRWIVLSTRPSAARTADVPLGDPASFVCLAMFCDWDEGTADGDAGEKVGQVLAEALLLADDGTETRLPLRRRFEVHSPSYSWGRLAFASRPHRMDVPRSLTDSLSQGTDWGELQTIVTEGSYADDGLGTLWISALSNPRPHRPLRALRLEARSDDLVALCGVMLFRGTDNPLRLERLRLHRLTLPEPTDEDGRWRLEVDLGVVGRTFRPMSFNPRSGCRLQTRGLAGARPL